MDEGRIRFQGFLDPRAQEFWPTNPTPATHLLPQIYYPYQSYPSTAGMQPVQFYNAVVGYQNPSPSSYVRPDPVMLGPSARATRALLLSSVPPNLSESTVRRQLEGFGPVRAVQMERLGEGIVTVHFFDLRNAQSALMAIQEEHMRQQRRLAMHYSGNGALGFGGENLRGCGAVWAQFAVPVATIRGVDGENQGTIVVFNLDEDVSSSKLKEIFEAFGPVKELRETPLKKHQRFIEFFDIRDAARALTEMNGKEIDGKPMKIEFGRPGTQGKGFPSKNTIISSSSSSSNNYENNNSNCIRTSPNFPPPPPFPPTLYTSYPNASMKISQTSGKPTRVGVEQGFGPRKNERKGSCNHSSNQSKPSRRRSSKSNHHEIDKPLYSDFLFKDDAVGESSSTDSRTTVMIKNIPNKYSQKLLLSMLDNHCIHCNEQISEGDDEPLSSYDFVYLPIDFSNKCNVGYGFVNLTSPKAARRLYKSFHLQPWEVFNSRKICEVTYARLQGLEVLKEHFKKSKFACETDEYLPVVFSPPRDGKQLPQPVAIGGLASNIRKVSRKGNKTDGSDSSVTKVVDGGDGDDHDNNNNSKKNGDGNEGEDCSQLSEVFFESCSLSTTQAQQPKALSCAI